MWKIVIEFYSLFNDLGSTLGFQGAPKIIIKSVEIRLWVDLGWLWGPGRPRESIFIDF